MTISSAASFAACFVSAITTATGSPTWRTLPTAITGCGGSAIGEPSLLWICQPQGSPPTLSAAMSAPVYTATTPGAFAAAAVSMLLILACGRSERRMNAWSWPGRLMSSV